MMLPQFGFIVAQAGADSHNLPTPPPQPTTSNSASALAPLLHSSKPFSFGHASSSMSTGDGYYRNNYTSSSLPYYSRQPSPPPSHNVIQQLPPPVQQPYLYNKPKGFTPILDKKTKDSPWYRPPVNTPFYHRLDQEEEEEEEDEEDEEEVENKWHGTHSAFKEMIADYEFKREKTITDAERFMKYQISFIESYFDQDLNAIEDEYEIERRHLQETLIASIEDRRRQIKDDKDENNDNDDGNVRTKRNLRKRNADPTALRAEPLSKRRAVRPSTLHNIHNISSLEDEELEIEYLSMK
ncbi:hypothetical protein INT48_005509, partial [Thamnidium elegans]